MPEQFAMTEAIGGLVVGGGSVLGALAMWLKSRHDGLKTQRDQQAEEHTAKMAKLEAERVAIEQGATVDLVNLDAIVVDTVKRLLPDAVAKVQDEERRRVALDRQKEQAMASQMREVLQALLDERAAKGET